MSCVELTNQIATLQMNPNPRDVREFLKKLLEMAQQLLGVADMPSGVFNACRFSSRTDSNPEVRLLSTNATAHPDVSRALLAVPTLDCVRDAQFSAFVQVANWLLAQCQSLLMDEEEEAPEFDASFQSFLTDDLVFKVTRLQEIASMIAAKVDSLQR